jgi:hypoxanthine-guanine phosphoribosyltransferase
MKTDTGQKIGISRVAVHRQLKKLVASGALRRLGRPPRVFYASGGEFIKPAAIGSPETEKFINENYLYVSPLGEVVGGAKGFWRWLAEIGKTKEAEVFARRFQKIRQAAHQQAGKDGLIDLTAKLKNTYKTVYLERVFCRDFYSLPEFGKTRLGQLVLYAKQSQSRKLIGQLAQESKAKLDWLIKVKKIAAVGFIPHSLPRQLQFLEELAKHLNLRLPLIRLEKVRSGEVIVAQKSLSKLSERVMNARETIVAENAGKLYSAVLLIDDAVGSGATLNETAKKLKAKKIAKKVYGFALVGSFKGFDVIREL